MAANSNTLFFRTNHNVFFNLSLCPCFHIFMEKLSRCLSTEISIKIDTAHGKYKRERDRSISRYLDESRELFSSSNPAPRGDKINLLQTSLLNRSSAKLVRLRSSLNSQDSQVSRRGGGGFSASKALPRYSSVGYPIRGKFLE